MPFRGAFMAPAARKPRDTAVGHPAVLADVFALFAAIVEHVLLRRASNAPSVHKSLCGEILCSAVFTVIVRHDAFL
jgi:hypothetical protein